MKEETLEKLCKKYNKKELIQTLIKTWHYNSFLRETLALEITGAEYDIDDIDEEEIVSLEDFLDHSKDKNPLSPRSALTDIEIV